MKKKALIGGVVLLVSSVLLGACNAPQQEIEKYIVEMGELASNLNAIETSAAQGNWEGAQRSLEQAKIYHFNIDVGIDGLEKKGVDSAQIDRGRVASIYLHKGFEVIDNMLIVHMKIAQLTPLMEGLSEGTKEDVAKALDWLNELMVIIRDTKSSVASFLDYANDYYSNNPDDGKKLHADTTIPKMEQLSNQLEEAESKFKNYIDTLSKT